MHKFRAFADIQAGDRFLLQPFPTGFPITTHSLQIPGLFLGSHVSVLFFWYKFS
jgi:hypothetical protein